MTAHQLMVDFIAEKKALGCVYKTEAGVLDRFMRAYVPPPDGRVTLMKEYVLQNTRKLPHQNINTVNRNATAVNQFLKYVALRGYEAYVIPTKAFPKEVRNFKARIFTEDEINRLLVAANSFANAKQCPLRGYQVPLLISILINCGLRTAELLNLRVRDVDLTENVFAIWEAKFKKDRYVPFSEVVAEQLERYLCIVQPAKDDWLLTNPQTGTRFSHSYAYANFREVLRRAGIPHCGYGPRLHDLRHTMAVRCLNNWVLSGVDVTSALPVLSRYLGHTGIFHTQKYLQLTAEMYPDITAKMERQFGGIIPAWEGSDEDD